MRFPGKLKALALTAASRRLLNTLLLKDEGSHFDFVIDVDAKFTQLAGLDYHLNPSYFRDKLHYSRITGGGSDIAAQLLEQKIRHLLP